MRSSNVKPYTYWTMEDYNNLRTLATSDLSPRAISKKLNRSENATRQAAFHLGIKFRGRIKYHVFTKAELEKIRKFIYLPLPDLQRKHFPKLTYSSLWRKVHEIKWGKAYDG